MTVTTLTRIPHNFVVLWQRSTVLYVPFSIWPTSCYSFYHWSLWSIRDITRQNLLNNTLFNTIQYIFIFSCNNQKPSLISHSAYTCTYTIGAWSPKSSWPWCSLHATIWYIYHDLSMTYITGKEDFWLLPLAKHTNTTYGNERCQWHWVNLQGSRFLQWHEVNLQNSDFLHL